MADWGEIKYYGQFILTTISIVAKAIHIMYLYFIWTLDFFCLIY